MDLLETIRSNFKSFANTEMPNQNDEPTPSLFQLVKEMPYRKFVQHQKK